jgi:hypothetical protein
VVTWLFVQKSLHLFCTKSPSTERQFVQSPEGDTTSSCRRTRSVRNSSYGSTSIKKKKLKPLPRPKPRKRHDALMFASCHRAVPRGRLSFCTNPRSDSATSAYVLPEPLLYALRMNATLVKALIAVLPLSAFISYAAINFVRRKTLPATLQLFGAGCLMIVVFAHVCEALHLFPSMHWGEKHSIGHYVDLTGAVLGLLFFPLGVILSIATNPKRANISPPKNS